MLKYIVEYNFCVPEIGHRVVDYFSREIIVGFFGHTGTFMKELTKYKCALIRIGLRSTCV